MCSTGKRERREAAWVLAKEGGAESEGGEAVTGLRTHVETRVSSYTQRARGGVHYVSFNLIHYKCVIYGPSLGGAFPLAPGIIGIDTFSPSCWGTRGLCSRRYPLPYKHRQTELQNMTFLL